MANYKLVMYQAVRGPRSGVVVEEKPHVGVKEPFLVEGGGPRHSRPERRDGQREHLVVMGIDPEAFRGEIGRAHV